MPKRVVIPDINPNMIHTIADKLNTLVKEYAKKSVLEEFLYSRSFEIVVTSDHGGKLHHGFKIYRIDMESEFKTTEKYKIYQNNPFKNSKKINFCEVLDQFIEDYYPVYSQIEDFIHRLLYQHPEKVTKDDFVKINTLYKKIVKELQIPNANEKIYEENRNEGNRSIW